MATIAARLLLTMLTISLLTLGGWTLINYGDAGFAALITGTVFIAQGLVLVVIQFWLDED